MAAPADSRHVLPVEGPVGPDRVGRRRQRAVHRPGAARAQAARRRHAPGRRPGRCRACSPWATAGRRGHDRAPRRGSRERPPAGRRDSPASTASARPAGSPSRTSSASASIPTRIATNFVLFRVDRDRAAFLDALEARGVLHGPYAHGQVRAVTHYGITADGYRPRRSPRWPRPCARPPPSRRATPRPAPPDPAPGSGESPRAGARRPTTRRPAHRAGAGGTDDRAAPGRRAPATRARRRRGAARRRASTTSSRRRVRRLLARQPGRRHVPRHPHRGPPPRRRRAATPCSARSRTTERTSRRSRRSTRGPVAVGAIRARPRGPQPPARPVRQPTRSGAGSGDAPRRASIGDGVFLLFARGAAPLSERIERIADRLAEAPGVPRAVEDAGDRSAGRGLAADRGALRRRPARAVRARSWRRRPRVLDGPALARHATGRSRRANAALGGVRRLADRARSPTPATTGRSVRSATTSWSGCVRSGTSTPTRSWRSDRSSCGRTSRRGERRRARSTPTPTCRASSTVSSPTTGHVRGGAGRLPRRHAPGSRLPHRARHRTIPADEHDRGHRDARVPARGHAVRRVLRARPVRRRPARAVHRHAGRRRRSRTRCASTTGRRSRTRASTRPTRATTSSSRSPPATRSLTRMLTDAPEFTEGWGMYSEQMMREEGFDDGPAFRVGHVHRRHLAGVPDHPRRPDAPRRADARGGDRLPRRAHGLRGRERAGGGPALHVHAGLPAALPAGQGPDPRPARGGAPAARRAFSLKAFHDTLLRNGSLPIRFHRRLLRGRGAWRVDVIPAIDVEKGRSRVVYWPGASAGDRRAHRPARSHRRAVRRPGRADPPSRRLRRRPAGSRRRTSRPSARSRRGSRCRSRSRAGWRRPTTCGSRSPRAPRGSCSRSR